jgi:predicted helicase
MDGLRKSLFSEFSAVYCINLRGNQRTSGETSRKEGGKIFGSGSRASVAITLLVKTAGVSQTCRLKYFEVADYLSREDKLRDLNDYGSIEKVPWKDLLPNDDGDWINQRNPEFERFIALGDKAREGPSIFGTYSQGILTARDAWTYSLSKATLVTNMRRTIAFYGDQVTAYARALKLAKETIPNVEDVIDTDAAKISWTRGLKGDVRKQKPLNYQGNSIVTGTYRPYFKEHLYFNRDLCEYVFLLPRLFPDSATSNRVIAVSGIGASKGFSALITDAVPNYHLIDSGQVLPLYYYEEVDKKSGSQADAFVDKSDAAYVRHDAITDWSLSAFQQHYSDGAITKEDLFYYIYGLLHSPIYRSKYEADLSKMLPRIPFASHFRSFAEAGRELAKWHLEYETVEPFPLTEEGLELALEPRIHYRVEKMVFGKTGKAVDKTVIHYNSRVTLRGIPLEAYEYIVNGKSAIEWIMERYQITKDKDSQIVNDPNGWCTEHEDPLYIVNLVKRIVRVSLETVRIVKGLPALEVQ